MTDVLSTGLHSPKLTSIALTCLMVTLLSACSADEKAQHDKPRSVATSETEKVVVAKVPSSDESDSASDETPEVKGDFRFEEESQLAQLNGQLVISTNVESLTPADSVEQFRVGQKVYVFAAVNAPQAETIHFDWFGPDGNPVLPSSYLDVEANTGVVGYRVFTYRVFRQPGKYRVALINSGGSTIGSTSFTLTQ